MLKKCERCGHEWLARVQRPVRCASCRSPYWGKARINPEVRAMQAEANLVVDDLVDQNDTMARIGARYEPVEE